MNDLHIGKVRLSQLKCSKCNQPIIKGSNCLFTKWTWIKFCLECGKETMEERLCKLKEEVKITKKLLKDLGKEKLVKENMCASLNNIPNGRGFN